MVDKDKIIGLLQQLFRTTGKITIDDLGLVSCTGSVKVKKSKQTTTLKRLPVSFDSVAGSFSCDNVGLTTLAGVPNSVGADFSCISNQLTSLAHSPQSVRGNFSCIGNRLTTLEHAPQNVGGDFACTGNRLTSLEGAPKSIRGNFWCGGNRLTTLQHAPQSVGGEFACTGNSLTSLEGAPKRVDGNFSCAGNELTTLEGLSDVKGTLVLSYSPTLPLLRCLLARKVQFIGEIENKTVETILNRYAGQGEAGAFVCGAELADAGYKENARW